ncbi:MAG: hypothetical protein IR526_01945 [Bordetella sp.]|nr:MAG: hypothetical protein IR526_01945 [Bordetella sp.]
MVGLLPDKTAASILSKNNPNNVETQFLVARKDFSNGITLSIEQAIASSETLGRISYRLSRDWTFDIKGGSHNGVALVYQTFFEN